MNVTIASTLGGTDDDVPAPTNRLVTPLLTDLYQITMTYAHWKNNRHNDPAVFELFFRKNPFGGEFTIFAGLDEVLKFVTHYKFSVEEVDYLRNGVPALRHCHPAFFDWLLELDTSDVKVRALQDGTVAFPRVPLLIVEAPLGIGQLIETTMLTLVNYPSLIATNAARMVVAASLPDVSAPEGVRRISSSSINGSLLQSQIQFLQQLPAQCSRKPVCVEFGLRRAQGPDGGFSASKYSAMGGFVATSNVQAGKYLGLSVSGTHAHSFVQSYSSLDEVQDNCISHNKTTSTDTKVQESVHLLPLVLSYRAQMEQTVNHAYGTTNDGELAAFIAYATAFPHSFLCLIDTYETLSSGLLNFIIVALVLDDLGYKPIGIRLDSGDLAYLSMECAKEFHKLSEDRPFFSELSIVASNDINEDVLHALTKQQHAVTTFGIGTNLVTCQAQPALGCVYKLVEISGKPRMKLSQEISKVLIPSKKKAYRLVGKDGRPILDLLLTEHEDAPVPGRRIMCRHPFVGRKRAAVTPTSVERLDYVVFEHGKFVQGSNRTLAEARDNVQRELNTIRPDILRYMNPTPYKVSVSEELFDLLHDLWQSETPVAELC
jgi:nicotinate phosphoribosyltransferase